MTVLRSRGREAPAGGEERRFGKGDDDGMSESKDCGATDAAADVDAASRNWVSVEDGVRTRGWDDDDCDPDFGIGLKKLVIEPFFDMMSVVLPAGSSARIAGGKCWCVDWALSGPFRRRQ
jgi:hypothetical protein